MSLVSILTKPPSTFSARTNATSLNRLAKSFAVMGILVVAGAWPSSCHSLDAIASGPSDHGEGVQKRAARGGADTPLRSRGAPGIRNLHPATRLASGRTSPPDSAAAWSGQL